MSEPSEIKLPEPWLRATHTELPVVIRAVVHALELADEEVNRWCKRLTDEQIRARPLGLEPASFQILHMARSIDRLLTYAEGQQLSPEQGSLLRSEMKGTATSAEIFREWGATFQNAITRVLALSDMDLNAARGVGKKQLQTTLGGILIHTAEHTQRHVGQMIATAKATDREE